MAKTTAELIALVRHDSEHIPSDTLCDAVLTLCGRLELLVDAVTKLREPCAYYSESECHDTPSCRQWNDALAAVDAALAAEEKP